YDELGRKKSDTTGEDAASWNQTRRYDYDARGLMWRATDALGNTTLSWYDLGGRKRQEMDANGLVTIWGYDPVSGLLTAHADIGGATYGYTYNQLGQLKQQTNSRGQNLVYAYFEDGSLKSLTDNYRGSSTAYDYDVDGNRTRETFTQSGTVFRDVSSVYDKQGRLSHTEDTAPGIRPATSGKLFEIDIGYDAAGNRRRVSTSSLGLGSNGSTGWSNTLAWYTYDAMNRWRGQGSIVNGAIQESKYTVFDAAGRAKTSVDSTYTSHYDYDFANRIVNEYSARANTSGAATDNSYGLRLDRHIDYLNGNQKETRNLYARDRATVTRIQYTDTNFLANGLTQQVKVQEEGLAKSYTYQARIKVEGMWEYVDRQATTTAVGRQDTGLQLYEYDRAGNVAKLTVNGYSPINADASLSNPDQEKRQRWSSQSIYRSSYYLMDGYRERGQALTGSSWTEGNSINSGATSFTPSESRLGYDANGQLAQVTRTLANGTQQNSWLITDNAGHIVQRREDTQAVTWGYSGTGYYNGSVVTSSQTNQDFIFKRWLPADTANPVPQAPPTPVGGVIGGTSTLPSQPAQRDASTWSRQSNFFINDQSVGNYTHTAYPNNIYAYATIDISARQSFSSQDASVQLYTVQDGDTLADLAQRNWGDAALWYVLADANGLTRGPQDALSAGSTLKVPRVVRSTNTSTSFSVYEPSRIIGNTSPEAVPPPPPVQKDRCGAMSAIIGVIVTVVVAVLSRSPVAGAAAGDAARQYSAAAFNGRLDYGDIARNLFGLSLGIPVPTLDALNGRDVFRRPPGYVGNSVYNYRSTALAAASAYAGGQISQAMGASAGAGMATTSAAGQSIAEQTVRTMATSAVTSMVTQGAAVALGLQEKFDWRSVVASAIAAPLTQSIGNDLGGAMDQNTASSLAGRTLAGMVRGVVGQGVRMLITRNGKMDYALIAADAFGNAVGESLASQSADVPVSTNADNRTLLNAAERAADPDRYTSWKGQFPDLSQFYGQPWSGDNVVPSVDRSQDIQLAAAKGYDGIGLGKAMPGDEPGTVQFNTLRGPQYRKRINDDGTTQEYYVLDPVVVTGKSKATRVLEAWAQQSEPVWSFREASEARVAQDMADYQARIDRGPQMSAITPEMDAAARAEEAQKEGLQNFLKAQGEMSVGGPVSAAMYLATRDVVAASSAADAMAPIEGFWAPSGRATANRLASRTRPLAGGPDFVPYRNQTAPLRFSVETGMAGSRPTYRIFSNEFILNGRITVPSRANSNGAYQFIHGTFDPMSGNLYISKVYAENRRIGIGTELISRAVEHYGPENVKSITGELGSSNIDIYNKLVAQGVSPMDAALRTPAAAIRVKLGYGNISFDPVNKVIVGTRP
ncbi:MAG TPA: hypothetical protein VIN58_01250, partial [Roseateles sp.]